MRRLKVVMIALVVMSILLVAGLVLSLNHIIANNRDRVVQSATTTLGRKVAVDTVTVSLWGGIGLRVANLNIADDPHFSDAPFARAAAVTAQVKLWPLLHGRVDVASIDVEQLEIQFVRDASGRWNYTSLKPFGAAAQPGMSSTAPRVITVGAVTPAA